MKLKIRSIHEQGKAAEEYVLLDVVEDCSVEYFGLADTTYTGTSSISNKLRHFFWFPPKKVKKGELVVLRTGVGNDDSYKNAAGVTVHRFFWGLKSAVWNNTGDAAVLFDIRTWKTTTA
jgi:hypothetical protein